MRTTKTRHTLTALAAVAALSLTGATGVASGKSVAKSVAKAPTITLAHPAPGAPGAQTGRVRAGDRHRCEPGPVRSGCLEHPVLVHECRPGVPEWEHGRLQPRQRGRRVARGPGDGRRQLHLLRHELSRGRRAPGGQEQAASRSSATSALNKLTRHACPHHDTGRRQGPDRCGSSSDPRHSRSIPRVDRSSRACRCRAAAPQPGKPARQANGWAFAGSRAFSTRRQTFRS